LAKYKLVISDLHLARGRVLADGSTNVLEDFVVDRQFEEFLEYYSSGNFYDADVEIVLNGDILNMIQVDYRGYYSPILTEAISVEKVRTIIKGHPRFFSALRNFAKIPNHRVTYVVGNHDVEMIWDKSKEVFAEAVGAPVLFKNFSYQVDGVHYEHGQQYEAVNRLNPKKIFITKGLREPIVNLPWGSHFVINFIIPIKGERPYVDKVRPWPEFIKWSLFNDTFWLIRTFVRAALYFFATRFSKSLYRTTNLVTTLKILKELTVYPSLRKSAQRILEENPDLHTVVMGHTHVPMHVQFPDGRDYINTGTWNEVTSLDLSSLGKATRMTYAFVDYTKNPARPHVYLREWKGRWHEDVDPSIGSSPSPFL